MSWDDLKKAKKIVGTKQVAKAVEKGIVRKVYVAKDADQHITAPLLRLCEERGIQIEFVDSMLGLGRACGLNVGAASCGILSQ
ncbi:MAG TPA: 50S ribosomal protein L7ae-like protein [Syntrophothermus lipocalidus]|uniref:ribosomal L7Ae/L30e/S12e/Gadd45 family protein n=1 Tax=Syntrophothermus sp. TaxID=2736299 RepID=UPI0018576F10|nr:ribosomal L7Ae/L30e/S12e/Gadd45 family protein [Syntrophothermus sp.]NSW82701.1 ribosomal L7Ae/L30e/S12e/Gadd45 family protein [Syntrophothermus sp.]HHV77819.1 50S ribosomal protein L7ae-like protein [Syntrophothermus lipocalidus]HOV43462.1 ribosomal L7Ae/L30e/S12e/Gadd45 family protein [Syntrophothermus lipocalidus]